jgi:hypothetical protein
MALLDLYFDVRNKRAPRSLEDSGEFSIRELHQEDSFSVTVYPVREVSQIAPPYYGFIGASGYAAKVSLGTAGVIYATTDLATPTADNNGITGTALDLSTSLINGLADLSVLILEIRLYSASTGYLRCHQQIAIRKSVALTAATNPVVNDTALLKQEALATYQPYEMPPGKGRILTSLDGTKRKMEVLDNDGTVRWYDI